jgi:hypothetical protein
LIQILPILNSKTSLFAFFDLFSHFAFFKNLKTNNTTRLTSYYSSLRQILVLLSYTS